jgi:hypothetical protein
MKLVSVCESNSELLVVSGGEIRTGSVLVSAYESSCLYRIKRECNSKLVSVVAI